MSLLPVGLPEWAAALIVAIGWALLLFLGQGLFIGLVVAAILQGLQGRSADLRYGAACVGLSIMMFCPVATTVWSLTWERSGAGMAGGGRGVASSRARGQDPTRATAVGRSAPEVGGVGFPEPKLFSQADRTGFEALATEAEATPIAKLRGGSRERVERWLPALVAAWLAGVAVLALRLVRGLVEVRGLTGSGLLGLTAELQALIDKLEERSGLRRPVRWFLSLRVEVPTVAGWLRPTVLIPAKGWSRLAVQQLEALLAHEIAHIRRHDYLVNMCQVCIETMLFFHPAVWWVSKRIRVERENCCDDMAVTLCGGDRLLVARALFALEEQRAAPVPCVAANGGSLRERIRRLITPNSVVVCPAEAGWAGVGLCAAAIGLVAMAWLAGTTHARVDEPPRTARPTVHGRVLDERGQPVAGARIRLYRRIGRWEWRHPVLEEVTAGPDGSYRLITPLAILPLSQSRGQPPYVVVADHPGKAFGWRIIPANAKTFEGDMTLGTPMERTITVIDAQGRPVLGAKVVAYGVGDPASPSPLFRDYLSLLPDDGPLTSVTGADGRAMFRQLPRTNASFLALKPGFADNYAFRDQDTIHLTPSASLSGTVTGPDGTPLPEVKVVLHPSFLWHFDHAVTDAKGHYQFQDLKARGWHMGAWGQGQNQTGNGQYHIWIDNEKFAMPTRAVTLEPNSNETLDIQAVEAGTIRVTLVEEGTEKPVVGARIWGWTGDVGSGRFNAYTDERGQATFHAAPEQVTLSLAGPPDGVYIKGDLHRAGSNSTQVIDFQGGEVEVTMTMPPIAGQLITLTGVCTRPDGTPAAGAVVHPAPGRFLTSGSMNSFQEQRADKAGRFILEGVPGGQTLQFYVETEDRKFANTATFRAPDKVDPTFRVNVALVPTVAVDGSAQDPRGKPLASRKFLISPQLGEHDFPFLRRPVESDAQGRFTLDGVLPGLSYHIQEDVPPISGAIAVGPGGRLPWYDQVHVLAPKTGK